LSEMWQ